MIDTPPMSDELIIIKWLEIHTPFHPYLNDGVYKFVYIEQQNNLSYLTYCPETLDWSITFTTWYESSPMTTKHKWPEIKEKIIPFLTSIDPQLEKLLLQQKNLFKSTKTNPITAL